MRRIKLIEQNLPAIRGTGYAGNLFELAQYVKENRSLLPKPVPYGVAGAEGLSQVQIEEIQKYLCSELFMSYGSREFMLIGMECSKHMGYHLSEDNLYVEVIDEEGNTCREGESGRILITDLHNEVNPFIRYEIGDIGSITREPCHCGLPFVRLSDVAGRTSDYLIGENGQRLSALFIPHLMKDCPSVIAYQAIQRKPGTCEMKLVTTNTLPETEKSLIVNSLKKYLGESQEILLTVCDSLQKTSSGKTPLIIRHDG